jgi:Family of unknown function (DUF6364)
MNLTLSIDERTLKRARKAAKTLGKSLNQVVREYLEELAGNSDREAVVAELQQLRGAAAGDSGGWRFNREELYD